MGCQTVVLGLIPGTDYLFRLAAINKEGASGFTDSGMQNIALYRCRHSVLSCCKLCGDFLSIFAYIAGSPEVCIATISSPACLLHLSVHSCHIHPFSRSSDVMSCHLINH